jgi:CHAT domain-containing protein/Tfp pilus assembly protein PilF
MRKPLLRLLPFLLLSGACTSSGNLPVGDPAQQGWSLLEAGRYAEAEPLLEQAVARAEREAGSNSTRFAKSSNDLAVLYRVQGRYAEAETLYKRAIAANEKALGPDHPNIATNINNLAVLYQDQGRYAEAEPLHRRALAIREAALGPDNPAFARSLNDLAELYRKRGRYAEAEPLHRRALAIREAALGPDHPEVATSLNDLGSLYRDQGRYAEAEPLKRRALAIREAALGPDHPEVATSLNDLALLFTHQGRYAEAEPLHRRALAIRERALGPDHPVMAESLNNLGGVLTEQGRYAEAEPLFVRTLAIFERALGSDHPNTARVLRNLAVVYKHQGRYAEAEPLLRRALAIQEEALGPDHPDLGQTLGVLATVRDGEGRPDEAMDAIRRAAAIKQARLARDAQGRAPGEVRDRPTRWTFPVHVRLASAQAGRGPAEERPRLVDEAFQAGQLLQATDTAAVLGRVAARFAAGDDALAGLVREREDAAERWRALDRAVLEAAGRPTSRRDQTRGEQLRRELAAVAARLDTLDRELRRRFPEYGELTSPEPASTEQVQGLLGPEEALLAYTILHDDKETREPEAIFLWLVRRDRAEMYELDLAPGELAQDVRRLRAQLDPGQWEPDEPPRFDAELAHRLHAKLLPVSPASLSGVRHLLVVPDGPLESLPFSVLVRAEPREGATYREVDWLARTYATTTLPSVSSLRALRRFAKPSRGIEPFKGVGDPALTGPTGAERGVSVAQLLTRGLANPASVRALPPLPETADELRTLARTLGAGEGSVLLRERATEAAVKAGALSNARVVAFATHAGVAGEFPGLAEPALVLTPPGTASEVDDGLLTASEAAKLRLNADLVLLSACNTAAPDGTLGATGLSGLSKSFIYAGSRALLVSHWAVLSDAAQRLTTGMFAELAREPGLGRAEALRRAELALLDDPEHPTVAHPAAWAPFVVVGEGGPTASSVQIDASLH